MLGATELRTGKYIHDGGDNRPEVVLGRAKDTKREGRDNQWETKHDDRRRLANSSCNNN